MTAGKGKGWATAGFMLGIVATVAGNIAHTWHPSAAVLAAAGKSAEQWRPELGAQLVAAFFPLALLVTVEVLARVQWPSSRGWSATRYGGTALVSGVAAVVSYLHLRGLMLAYGEDALTSTIGPLSVDGLMVVCGFALVAIGRTAADQLRPAVVEASSDQREDTGFDQPRPTVADMVENMIALRPLPAAVVDEPLVDTENGTDPDHDFNHMVDRSAAGQQQVSTRDSAIRSARAAGQSERSVAEEFGLTRYQVQKIVAEADEPERELVSTTSASPADHNGHAVNNAFGRLRNLKFRDQ